MQAVAYRRKNADFAGSPLGLSPLAAVVLSAFLSCSCADSLGEPAPPAADSKVSDAVDAGVSDTISVADVGDDVTPQQLDSSGEPSTWRSELYPVGGSLPVKSNGVRLIDYSYAGYRNGDVPIAAAVTTVVDAVAMGADPTSQKDSTKGIQSAINKASVAGGVVVLPPGTYRCDGTLAITASNVVLRGSGAGMTKLWFTKHSGMSNKAHVQIGALPKRGSCFSAHKSDSPEAAVYWQPGLVNGGSSQDSLKPGDDIAVGQTITPDFVAEYGMTGTWKAFNGTWQPFEQRDVLKVSPNWHSSLQISTKPSFRYRYRLRDNVSVCRYSGYIEGVGVEDLSVANAVEWTDAWANNQVHAIAMVGVKDSWIRRVSSFDPPGPKDEGQLPNAHLQSSGILIKFSKRVTVSDCHLQRAQHRGGGGNGYLFEIRQSSEVLTTGCTASHGRHNFIQNWGFGTSGCVWHDVVSSDGKALLSPQSPIGTLGYSEFHHSLAMFNLVDASVIHDGWASKNRGQFSTGAGHTATENTLWNITGGGQLQSYNFGNGYVIGTGPAVKLHTKLPASGGEGTQPEDWIEGAGAAGTLAPQSLYLAQLAKRLGKK